MICSARVPQARKSPARRTRSSRAQSLVEALTGFVILIPLGLAAVDVVAFVSAVDSNEHLAEAAARAAAKAPSQDGAQTIAEDVVKHCTPAWMVQRVMVDDVEYSAGKGVVSVATLMNVKLPIPLPGYTEVSCRASSIEPIVFTPAPN
ncbi:MAG: hypothetical protein IT343_15535 [Candidatus Melainabacteria bacterium]|nr:hypothetical protein [Candidatus Melainabacteria bacterium]